MTVKINKSFAPVKRDIRYLAKTFADHRQNLIDFAKVYFPDTNTDFNESSPGMMFVEMAAYVGDVLGYYIDTNFRENLLSYAQEQNNIITLAQSFGFKPKPTAAATCDVDLFQLCPAKDITSNYAPDERFYLRLSPSAIFSSNQFPTSAFRTIQEVNFADPSDREITVYATDVNNKPLTYLIKKKVHLVAGNIKQYVATFGTAQRFAVVSLPDSDIIDVISAVDANGNKWYEVDFLAQDIVFDDSTSLAASTLDLNFSVPPTYALNLKRVPRRFVTRYSENFKLEVHFGSGVLDDTDAKINFEPKKLANSEYQTNLGSTSLDPSDFLSSRSYGLSPSNTSITFTYSVGGGIESNVASNSLTKVVTITPLNDVSTFTPTERALWNDVVHSIAINNPDPATGGKGADSTEEIRQNALGFFNAQNRLVTAEDYIARSYAMPPKYGGVAKVFVTRDEQINGILRSTQQQTPQGGIFVTDQPGPGVINLYTLGYNQYKKLSTLNRQSKKNLATYLDQYRMLTDNVRIMDAFVVNIGARFKVVAYKNYNMNEVLARCIAAVQDFFDLDRWQINQPIVLNDLWIQLANIDGVQSVLSVEIFNRYKFQDGSDYQDYLYDINAATNNNVIYPSLDPCIFELRYPEKDIIGAAIQ